MNPFHSLMQPLAYRPGDYMRNQTRGKVYPRRASGDLRNPWGLSPTQAEVARRLSTRTTADIGRELGITDKVVLLALSRAMEKMSVATRNDVARLWTSEMEAKTPTDSFNLEN